MDAYLKFFFSLISTSPPPPRLKSWVHPCIQVNYTQKNKNKIRVVIEYVCSKEGFRRQCNEDNERTGPKRAKTRVGFKAMIGLMDCM